MEKLHLLQLAGAALTRLLNWSVALFYGLALGWAQQLATENPPPEGGPVPRQAENKSEEQAVHSERWNLFYQATSIGQHHGQFHALYEGPSSLEKYPERDV